MTELNATLVQQIMSCDQGRADECTPALISACRTFAIDTPRRLLEFLTQVRWESGGLVYFAELASGDAYEGRADLGNTQSGDGPRFKGSGPIQVTGRSNFASAQQALDAAGIAINILTDPDLARTVQYGFWISCWWWSSHDGNTVAEQGSAYQAAIRCGRLVNRGDADSPYQAQDEGARLDAFAHVSQFGDLTLPPGGGSTPVTATTLPPPAAHPAPTPPADSWDTMDQPTFNKFMDGYLATKKIPVAWDAKDKTPPQPIPAILANLFRQSMSNWRRLAAMAPQLSGLHSGAALLMFRHPGGGVGLANLAARTWRSVSGPELLPLAAAGVPAFNAMTPVSAAEVGTRFGKQVSA